MIEVECLVKKNIIVDNKEFSVVEEKETKENYYIPSHQINIFNDLKFNKYYFFLKTFSKNKIYLNIIHPKYKIGNIVDFEIISRDKKGDQLSFLLKSELNFPLRVKGFNWQENLSYVKCKIVGYKKAKPVLKNIDSTNKSWAVGDVIFYKVNGFCKIIDRKKRSLDALIVQDNNGNELKVRAGKWHTESIWNYKDIKCKIIGITTLGLPKLMIYDERHPNYKINGKYKFRVKGFEDKILFNGTRIKIINLIDEKGGVYEVRALPNQENKLVIGKEIECEVVDINTRVHLKQINIDDPFYYSFDEVVKDKELKERYFKIYLNDENESNSRLKSQYLQRSGFWVITYCNHILTSIKYELTQERNYQELLNVIKLIIDFENWILKKGILKSIKDIKERELIQSRTKQIIENNLCELNIINFLVNFEEKSFFEKQRKNPDFREIYYFLKYSSFSKIQEIDFIIFLESVLTTYIVDSANYFFVKKSILLIQRIRKTFTDTLYQDYFILSKNLNDTEKINLERYINLLFIELNLTRLIQLDDEANLLIAKFYRLSTYLINDFDKCQKLLLNAFHFLSNDKKFNANTEIINNKIEIIFEKIPDNPNQGFNLDTKKEFQVSKITDLHYQGFKVVINDVQGFLPIQNVYDINLKRFNNRIYDWDTNVEFTLYCDKFSFFICKQLKVDSLNYYSEDKLVPKTPTINEIAIGVIKKTTDYGIFVSTEYGDGLIHLSKISKNYIDRNMLPFLFKEGESIPVYILNVNDKKLEFSLIELIGTEYEKKYYDVIRYYETDEDELTKENDERGIKYRQELEKGFIFEQYATIQNSILDKIKYIKFAKAFFSNTKNARSYLLNIYIEYFNSLLRLDELLQDYTFEKYKKFKSYIIKIKDKVQPKTLVNYPESRNLLFFIDILSLFNSQTEEDIEHLFKLIREPIEENNLLLKTVAKSALANNLIISELENDNNLNQLDEFTFKNLKRIREYISQGVLSIEESIEDKRAKELKKKIKYWKKLIREDEGEKLEFKSTLITPVPSNHKKRIIENLQIQLKKSEDINENEKILKRIREIEFQSKNIKLIKKRILHSALKTICAFANTNGGYLLLGVSDDKEIFGLEQDYNSFKNGKNRDEFGKYFDLVIKDYFGESFSSSILEKEFLKFPEGDILIVKVNQSFDEIFLLKNENGEKEENLYVRNLSSSVKLKGIELSKFIKNRMRKRLVDS